MTVDEGVIMYHMVMLVLDDVNQCTPIVDAWEEAGVGGITIFESTGLGRIRGNVQKNNLSIMPSLLSVMRSREERHRTMFTVVDSDEMVDKLIEITQSFIGDMMRPNKGVIFVMPVSRVVGLRANWTDE